MKVDHAGSGIAGAVEAGRCCRWGYCGVDGDAKGACSLGRRARSSGRVGITAVKGAIWWSACVVRASAAGGPLKSSKSYCRSNWIDAGPCGVLPRHELLDLRDAMEIEGASQIWGKCCRHLAGSSGNLRLQERPWIGWVDRVTALVGVMEAVEPGR
ncbi:hypothetical protein ACLOJK_024146 [Asimina triloba]